MIKKNVFFVLLFLVIIMSSSLKADTLPLLIYDDFTADTINSSLWSIDDPNGVFTQSNGFLKSDSPPNSAFASINSINTFNGDFEFILPYQNFSSTAFLKDKGDTPFPSIRLLAKVNSYPEISVQISRCQEYQGGSGGVFISDEFTDGAITGNDYISSSTSSGNLKIQRIGSTIKTFYKEESQWITLGNYSNAPTDDATIEILASTGFNGLFKVEMDAVYYTDNQISTLYYDSDGDGYGDPSNAIDVESEASGYVTNNLDCDDTNASIHPGAFDHFWDGIDQDCDDTNSDTNLGYGPGQTLDSVSDDNWVYEGRMYDAISTAPLSKSIKVTDKDLRMELFSKDCMDNGILDCERKKRRSQIIEVNKFPMNTTGSFYRFTKNRHGKNC